MRTSTKWQIAGFILGVGGSILVIHNAGFLIFIGVFLMLMGHTLQNDGIEMRHLEERLTIFNNAITRMEKKEQDSANNS